MLWHYIVIGLVCLLAGFWIGGRHGRKVKRDAVRELNTNSLDLLETKSKFSGIEEKQADYQRQENLLELTLQQLKSSNALAQKSHAEAERLNALKLAAEAQVKKLQKDLITLSKQQAHNQSLLKQKALKSQTLAVHSHKKAVEATSLARKATAHLKRLENALTSKSPDFDSDQKHYINSDRVKLSVIDHPGLKGRKEIIRHVSNSDSTRLAKLSSSNESTRPLN